MWLLIALVSVGYMAGVWTACLVLRQPQRAFEDGVDQLAADRQIEPPAVIGVMLEADA